MKLLALTLLIGTRALAADCGLTSLSAREVHNFPTDGYWMQAAGNRYVTFTEHGGTNSHMYDLQSRHDVPITRDEDAFPLPDGDLYVHPNPIHFVKMKDALSKGPDAQAFFTDPKHTGWYQSVGQTASQGDERTIRVLTAEGTGMIQDYKVKKSGDDYQIDPVYPKPVPACGNMKRDKLDWETPMISRNGRLATIKDAHTGTTRIYELNLPSGGCRMIKDLGVDADKVSFSFDNDRIAYTQLDHKTYKHVLFEYQMSTGKTRVVSGPSEDVQYQTYRPDGGLMYTRWPDRTKKTNATTELVILDKNFGSNAAGDWTNEALGRMWAKACGKELDKDTAMAVGIRLTQKACSELITDENMSALSGQLKNVTKDNLASACAGPGRNSATAQSAAQ